MIYPNLPVQMGPRAQYAMRVAPVPEPSGPDPKHVRDSSAYAWGLTHKLDGLGERAPHTHADQALYLSRMNQHSDSADAHSKAAMEHAHLSVEKKSSAHEEAKLAHVRAANLHRSLSQVK